jgi:transcriptional regulator with XRE-family HTH domain
VKSLTVLSQNLRRLRLATGLTQQEFSEKVEMGYKHYQDVEAGRAPGLLMATVDRLAAAHGVEVWTLFHPNAISEPKSKKARAEKIDR